MSATSAEKTILERNHLEGPSKIDENTKDDPTLPPLSGTLNVEVKGPSDLPNTASNTDSDINIAAQSIAISTAIKSKEGDTVSKTDSDINNAASSPPVSTAIKSIEGDTVPKTVSDINNAASSPPISTADKSKEGDTVSKTVSDINNAASSPPVSTAIKSIEGDTVPKTVSDINNAASSPPISTADKSKEGDTVSKTVSDINNAASSPPESIAANEDHVKPSIIKESNLSLKNNTVTKENQPRDNGLVIGGNILNNGSQHSSGRAYTDEEREAAAIKIQCFYRAYVRNRGNRNKSKVVGGLRDAVKTNTST